MAEPIFIFGAGGHGKVVISVVEEQGMYRIVWLADDEPSLKDKNFYGYRIVGGKKELLEELSPSEIRGGLIALGDNHRRLDTTEWLGGQGFHFVKAVHPLAQLARGVTIGDGTVVMAGTVINADTAIGKAVIINTGATVDHDCAVGDGAHIAPGCHICGNVRVGAATLVGAGSTVIPGITIGENTVIGAGSVVIRDVPPNAVVAGNPCRPLAERRGQG